MQAENFLIKTLQKPLTKAEREQLEALLHRQLRTANDLLHILMADVRQPRRKNSRKAAAEA